MGLCFSTSRKKSSIQPAEYKDEYVQRNVVNLRPSSISTKSHKQTESNDFGF